ncbi:MAG TPA: ScbR family autoregulator-binding transcription factor [Actinomycetota bacterium]|nr:ScbR family autoregulator-binding transcription factor [Actinomycetota bacterium]
MATAVPVTGRGEGTRRCILDEAALAFARAGYAGTSLNDVIAATGLTKGAFYFHFASKEALALEVFRSKQHEWAAKAVEAAGSEERALDKLLAMTRATCDVHEIDPAARAVARLCWDLGEDPALAPQMTPFLTNWFDIVEDVLRRAQEEGDVRADVDARAVAEVCVASFIGINDVSHLLNGNVDLREKAEQLMDLILRAILTDKASKRRRAPGD